LMQKGRTEESTLVDESVPEKNITFKNHYEGTIQFSFAGSNALIWQQNF
jgi:hypothetical protein